MQVNGEVYGFLDNGRDRLMFDHPSTSLTCLLHLSTSLNASYHSISLTRTPGALHSPLTPHKTNGHFAPLATAFGSYLGTEEISAEEVTNDGGSNAESFSSAVDRLALYSKSLQTAFAHGVTRAISAPAYDGGGHKVATSWLRGRQAPLKHLNLCPRAEGHEQSA